MTLEDQLKQLGALIPCHTGGTFENDPPDAIIDAAIRYLKAEPIADMDIDAFLNARDWLEKALQEKGAKLTDGGIGAGRVDIGFTLLGMPFSIQLRPRLTGEKQ